jgi:hypothetical protein
MLLRKKEKNKVWQKKWAYLHIELRAKYHAQEYTPKQNIATTKVLNTTKN